MGYLQHELHRDLHAVGEQAVDVLLATLDSVIHISPQTHLHLPLFHVTKKQFDYMITIEKLTTFHLHVRFSVSVNFGTSTFHLFSEPSPPQFLISHELLSTFNKA